MLTDPEGDPLPVECVVVPAAEQLHPVLSIPVRSDTSVTDITSNTTLLPRQVYCRNRRKFYASSSIKRKRSHLNKVSDDTDKADSRQNSPDEILSRKMDHSQRHSCKRVMQSCDPNSYMDANVLEESC